ncbi:restriction endonuclease subunit S [Elizabethkingia anophelis]|uniref:restriction endonuclease subunit S n=1 Tax=Elizabethkingia anophelis TaxID=1117645 RepID=UPI000B358045|nr:restriction endonuclease subunit S [Elizabethkingia anophelis]MDV3662296.1 restriction endonuclease subunit S [Elizabethkingia anophelis]MYY25878.1 restriction endonuclease subunit S [Elizabethkingia anophelis]
MIAIEKNIPDLRFPEFNDKWKERRIKEITQRYVNPVEVIPDTYYKEIGIRSHGKGLFHKEPILGEELGNKRVFWIKENAFIVNIVFAWEQAIGKTTEKEIGMIASHRFPMYLPRDNKSSVDFLLYFFLTPKGKSLLELASPGGAGRNKTLGQKEFDNVKFYIPEILEQQKIASFLNVIDTKIEQLEKKKNFLEKYKKGIMQKIFSREIRFKDELGNDYPDWEEKTLGEIGKSYGGLTNKNKENFGEGKPYIQYKQVFSKSKIDINQCDLVQIDNNENQNKVQFGDVFFTVSSESAKEVGISSVLLDEVNEMYLNSFCFGYRINDFNILQPFFAQFLFETNLFREKVILLAQGSTRYNISKVALLKLKVQLPSSKEQLKIAEFLTSIDRKLEATMTEIYNTNIYKKGLMQKMFV